jgi:hypothetical protein
VGKDEDEIAAKDAAPETPDEWRTIRSGVDKSHKAWVIVGPIHAVVMNWKALAIVVAVVLYLNRPDIIASLRTLAGLGK